MKTCTALRLWFGLIQAVSLLSTCIAIAIQRTSPDLARTIDDCTLIEVVTKVYIVEPIYINTFVETNTTFTVNDHLTITVDNAPTSFNGIVHGTSTSLITSSQTVYVNYSSTE